jgi:hypothetical protein
VSRDEGELLIVRMPRAVVSLPVCPSVKPVGEPDALMGHLRFDGRSWETGRCPNGLSYPAHPRLYRKGRADPADRCPQFEVERTQGGRHSLGRF